MSASLDLAPARLLALPHASLSALRSALLRDVGSGYAAYLQEAAYAGGDAVWNAFSDWLQANGEAAPDELAMDRFRPRLSEYLRESGWGSITIDASRPSVIIVDSPDWAEADPAAAMAWPACYYATGMFADLFGRVAGAPLAAMEVECRSAGAPRCRWLLGSGATMAAVYEAVAAGQDYAPLIND